MKSVRIHIIIALFGLLLSALYFYPIIFSKGEFGIQDWDQNFAWNEFTRLSIRDYGQFPHWNPYRCGGLPHFGNPEIGVLSMQTMIVLLLGTIVGIKTSIVLYISIGFFGFFLYAKRRMMNSASLFAAILYAFSGVTASFFSTGMVVFAVFAFIPYIILCYEKGIIHRKYLFLAAVLFALSYYNGYHIPLLMGVYLFFYSLILAIVERSFTPLIRFIQFALVATVIMLPKLILAVELLRASPVTPFDHSGYTFTQFVTSLLSPFQDLYHDRGIRRYSWKVDETSLYIGFPAFFLFLLALRTKWEKKKFITIGMLLILLMLAFGYQSIIPLYPWMKELPVLGTFRVAQRFRFMLIIPISLLVGYGFETVMKYFDGDVIRRKAVMTLFLVILCTDLLYFAHSNYFFKTLIYNISIPPRRDEFSQVRLAHYDSILVKNSLPKEYEDTRVFSMWSFEYPSIRENKGVINCSDTVMNVRKSAGKDKRGYRGEWYLQNKGGDLKVVRWTPQEIELKVHLTKVLSDIVVVNQNYYPGWYVYVDNVGPMVPHEWNNLLSIPIKEHTKKIIFRYEPYRDIDKRILKIIKSHIK